jgi:hypothetical protein
MGLYIFLGFSLAMFAIAFSFGLVLKKIRLIKLSPIFLALFIASSVIVNHNNNLKKSTKVVTPANPITRTVPDTAHELLETFKTHCPGINGEKNLPALIELYGDQKISPEGKNNHWNYAVFLPLLFPATSSVFTSIEKSQNHLITSVAISMVDTATSRWKNAKEVQQ